jgi:hypothetical protein
MSTRQTNLISTILLFIMNSYAFASSNYFPLAINNNWTFQSKFLISTKYFAESIIDKQVIDNKEYFVFDEYRLGAEVIFRSNENKIVTLISNDEYLLYNFGANVHDRWDAPDPPKLIFGKMTLESKTDTIQTPIGIFYNCYHFHHFLDAANYYDEWFAPDVGLVMRHTILMGGKFESKLYDYSVTAVDVDYYRENESTNFKAYHNYPNPFNAKTTISYQLPVTSHIELTIYSITGQKISTLVSDQQQAGIHRFEWDAKDLASGVYIYQLQAEGFTASQKLILLK